MIYLYHDILRLNSCAITYVVNLTNAINFGAFNVHVNVPRTISRFYPVLEAIFLLSFVWRRKVDGHKFDLIKMVLSTLQLKDCFY